MAKLWPDRLSRDPGLHVADVLILISYVAISTSLIWYFVF